MSRKSSMLKPALACIYILVLTSNFFAFAQPCTLTWYRDYDGDGFGNVAISSTTACSAAPLSGFVLNKLDCNDSTSNPTSWNVTETGALSSNAINNSTLKASYSGDLYLLYRNYISASDIPVTVKKYDGTTWTTVGSDPVSTDLMYGADIAISPQNEVYVSYLDFVAPANGNNKASVLKYNGSAWAQLGDKRFSSSLSDNCSVSIAISGSGIPYVLTCKTNGLADVYEYDSGTDKWKTLGTNIAAFSIPKGDLKIDKAGNIYVAFTEASTGKTSVIMYNGSSWEYVGAAGISDNDTDVPQFVISESGQRYVSYFDYGSNEIVVKKIATGASDWETLGGAVHAGASSSLSLTVDRYDIPYLAFRDDVASKVVIKKGVGNTWTEVASNLSEDGLSLSMTMNPATNLPAFSYQNLNLSDYASVRTLGFQITAPSLTGINSTQTTICQGQTSSLSANGNLNHASRWSWYSSACGTTPVGTGASLDVAPGDTTNYFVRAEGGCLSAPDACIGTQVNVLDTVQIATTLAPPVICEGDGYNLSVQSVSGSGVSYQWYKDNTAIPGATTSTLNIASVDIADAGSYKLLATGTCNSKYSSVSTLSVNSVTNIQTQLSSTTVCEHSPATFSLNVNGSGLSYQWYKNNVAISGETLPVLEFLSTAATDSGWYSVAISGACGNATSIQAYLEVLTNPVITLQPVNASVCINGNASFVVEATGNISGYQWYKNGASLPGATSNELSISPVTSTYIGNYYVSIGGDCGPVVSNTVYLQQNTPNYIANQSPATVEICNNGNYTLSITPSASGLTFQWYVDQHDGNGWQLLSGAIDPAFELSNITATADGHEYKATVSSTSEGCSITSAINTISVVMPPVILTQPTSQSTCFGSDVLFSVTAAGNDLHYQWQEKVNGIWIDLSGETASELRLGNVSASLHGTYYRASVRNNACAEIHSDSAALLVYNTPGEGPCLEFIISEAITPNGDGILDQWVIQGIERYPENEVKVFNIWGDIIFETSGYRNESNCWNGKNHHQGIMEDINLPDGNYFYQLSLGDGSSLKTGFIRLKR